MGVGLRQAVDINMQTNAVSGNRKLSDITSGCNEIFIRFVGKYEKLWRLL